MFGGVTYMKSMELPQDKFVPEVQSLQPAAPHPSRGDTQGGCYLCPFAICKHLHLYNRVKQ